MNGLFYRLRRWQVLPARSIKLAFTALPTGEYTAAMHATHDVMNHSTGLCCGHGKLRENWETEWMRKQQM